MALLLITHDLGIARRMAKRVCVMSEGLIVEQGPVAQVFDDPQDDYTRHLLAAEPKGRPKAKTDAMTNDHIASSDGPENTRRRPDASTSRYVRAGCQVAHWSLWVGIGHNSPIPT